MALFDDTEWYSVLKVFVGWDEEYALKRFQEELFNLEKREHPALELMVLVLEYRDYLRNHRKRLRSVEEATIMDDSPTRECQNNDLRHDTFLENSGSSLFINKRRRHHNND
eukprot:Awhi_evm1s1969